MYSRPRASILHHTSLKRRRLDVIHTIDVGMERATDSEIIDYARTNNLCCVTLDADFHSIIAVANEHSPSVIRIRQEGLKGEDVASLLQRIYPDIKSGLEGGALVTVTEKSVRIRQLPIQSR